MSTLLNLSIDVANLPKEKFVKAKNGKVYYNFTVSINDETNQFGQNVSAFDSMSKEEREAGKNKIYIGNGKVVWTDGSIVVAERKEQDAPAPAPQVEETNTQAQRTFHSSKVRLSKSRIIGELRLPYIINKQNNLNDRYNK